jgi:hypothetical protein
VPCHRWWCQRRLCRHQVVHCAQPDDCAVKTLELLSGVHSGAGNVKVGVSGNESVALVGHRGAIIDGGGKSWLLSVIGNGSLALTNLALQHGFARVDTQKDTNGGAALYVYAQGKVNVTSVSFLENTAVRGRGGAVQLTDIAADTARWLVTCFSRCVWEGNGVTPPPDGTRRVGTLASCPLSS